MNNTKIDWCTKSWNPISGCLNQCPYCYARKIAKRFCSNEHGTGDGILAPCDGKCIDCSEMDGLEFVGDKVRFSHDGNRPFPYGFMPTFYRNRLSEPEHIKKPQNIFVCSMADLFGDWVPDELIQAVFKACEAAPQHRYHFLTKNPQRYRILQSYGKLPYEHWYGTTIQTRQGEYFSHSNYRTFLSIEPIMCRVDIDKRPQQVLPDWVIVGAETGNRKGKVIPEKWWIRNILNLCSEYNTPIFMKESIRELMGSDFIQEYPWRAI